MNGNIAVLGSSGALGNALVRYLHSRYPQADIHAFSRRHTTDLPGTARFHPVDYEDEISIEKCASIATHGNPLRLVIVATGILYDGTVMPEKSLRDLSAEKFLHVFRANTVFPALAAKYFLPGMDRTGRSVFAALSARIGSIRDNRLGGWYAYRASKAALNMVIRNAAIETARYNRKAIVAGLHPGTVASRLSAPFRDGIPSEKIFTPDFSARRMVDVLERLVPEQTGRCFAWNGLEIDP